MFLADEEEIEKMHILEGHGDDPLPAALMSRAIQGTNCLQ